ncbi:MAG: MotA/TolQ/ExbB proton channel family protein [Chitinispirillaceae bacterium]|nr:MotA/TolQ/ExbB proton channel family protein [Chitinispirillaceae bacterium]
METPLISMILRSGLEARVVLFILLVFSLITWSIVFNRVAYLRHAMGTNRRYRLFFDGARSMADLEQAEKTVRNSPMARIGAVGAREFQRIKTEAAAAFSMKDFTFYLQSQFTIAAENIEGAMIKTIPALDKGVFLLAVIASLSPFFGLLGTVWGIMNSFYEIGNQGSASLPVVAPGIAEALVVTFAGLSAGIPALFFYNYFMHRVERIENELDEFREMLVVRLKREVLDRLYVQRRGNA